MCFILRMRNTIINIIKWGNIMYEDLNYLDDNVCVCYTCYKNGNITTMKINPKDNQFLLPPDCGHMKKRF